MCNHDGRLLGFEHKQNALTFWEDGYEAARRRGLCGATGALIAYIACQPSVVYFETQQLLLETLFKDPPYQIYRFNSGVKGIETQRDVLELWEKGFKPELIPGVG